MTMNEPDDWMRYHMPYWHPRRYAAPVAGFLGAWVVMGAVWLLARLVRDAVRFWGGM